MVLRRSLIDVLNLTLFEPLRIKATSHDNDLHNDIVEDAMSMM